jgi:drug/metabolite transporter (DMT)-like permease
MSHARPDLRWVVAFVSLWAAEEALTALVLGRYGLAQVVWLRFAMHLVLLTAIFVGRDVVSLVRTRRPFLQLTRGSMMVLMPACWLLGVEGGMPPSTVMSLFWLAPLMILVLARLALGESASPRLWMATAAACGGVFALTGPHPMPRFDLLVFPIGMALSFSAFVVMSRALRDEAPQANLFYIGLPVVLILAPLMPAQWVTPTPADLLIQAGIAVLGLGGLVALQRLTTLSRVTDAAPLAYLQIPFAVAIGWSIEERDPALRTLFGLAVIVAVAWYAWHHAARAVAVSSLASETGHGNLDTRP